MRRRARSILAVGALLIGGASFAPIAQAQPSDSANTDADEVKVFRADVTQEQVPLLLAAGQDGHELGEQVPDRGTATVEVYLTDRQAGELEKQGVDLKEHTLSARAEERVEDAAEGVFRPYSGSGGLREEILRTAQEHPRLTKVVSIGKTVNGQDILALKLTKHADRTRDGSKPAVLYMSNQHAREWITPEMTRRLMHHYLDNYEKDRRIRKLVDSTELWFLLSANPDGYDYTFQNTDNRLWRKNLRDNNGDGAIGTGDGVDLNRNFAYKWGYDDEGSSPNPTSQTYRGPGPNSEPETKALDRFQKRIGFAYGINYHSAAELLLYGVGWQVATHTPDDVLYQALAGTPENSAIPGYRPQVSSELYTTNGEADGHAANVNGMAMFTPEMSTCQTISDQYPDDEWNAGDCQSGFNFPDDEKLIQEEFEKNIPFALSVAESAAHPDRPSSSVGIEAADFTPAPFATSYARGADQEVSVVVRKSVRDKELKYRVNGGRVHDMALKPWRGGETYGGEDNLHFDEYRAEVKDGDRGDKVEVWFTGETKQGKRTESEHFTYTIAERPRADVLVVAEEGAKAAHARTYVDALKANGKRAAVWDVATQGAPDALGVLGHFDTVVHYTGAANPGNATQLQLRAYLNEGGRLIEAGERAGGSVDLGDGTLSNDFSQYYLAPTPAPPSPEPPDSPAPAGSAGPPARSATPPATRWTPPAPTASPPTSCPPTPTRSSRARAPGSSPGRSTRTGPTRAPGWPPPSTPTTPTSASPAPSTSPASPPPTVPPCAPSSCGTPRAATTTPWSRRTPPAPTTGPRSPRRAARPAPPCRPSAGPASTWASTPGWSTTSPCPTTAAPPPAPPGSGTASPGPPGMAAGRVRPERLRRQVRGRLDLLRHRPRQRRTRRPRRRRLAGRRRRGDADRGLRDLARRLAGGRTAGRQPRRPEGLDPHRHPVPDPRRRHHGRHRAPRLRPGAPHRTGRRTALVRQALRALDE